MKKVLLLLLSSLYCLFATNVVVSIAPQKLFVKKIGGDKVTVEVMVPTTASAHTYTPKPSQMKSITHAKIYFSTGMEFEDIWLEKFKAQNRDLIIADTTKDINRTILVKHHGHEELDPHIWVDPINVKNIAQNIYTTLSQIDSNNSDYYKTNLENYLKELDELDNTIKKILKDVPKDTTFIVFHPAWGYFAKRYHLKQLSVEVEGKEPKMRELITLIKRAKKEHVQAIFTQPEFSDKSAKLIAKELGIEVIKTSPLAEDWAENLIRLARAIEHKKSR